MKKIMFIMPNNGYSGAERVSLKIIENLKDKYNFVYVSESGSIDEYLKERNVKHILTDFNLNRNELIKIVKHEQPDIIHASDYRASTVAAFLGTNIPVISHIHNNSPWIKKINKNSLIYFLAGLKIKRILTVSAAIEKEYIFSRFLRNKIKNISNPLSRKDILDMVDIKKINKKYDICFIGRLVDEKDPLRFIEIIKEIKKNNPKISAIMIGDGNLKEECKKAIEKEKLIENINLIGYTDNPYIEAINAKIFITTSKWEGFGLVAYEALTLGLPVLATPVGGLVDIVDESCGVFCKANEEFIKNALDLLTDEDKYIEFSKNAIKKSEKLENIKDYLNIVDEVYKELTQKNEKES